jgi:putative molybdopterin biosynthesis protein
MTPTYLTVQETAHLLRVSAWTVYQLARRGLLPCVRVGRQLRIRADRLDSVLPADPLPALRRRRRAAQVISR